MNYHKLTPSLIALGWWDMTGSSEWNSHLLLRYSHKSVLAGLERSNTETQGSWMLAFLGWKARGLALEAGFLAVGEAKIALPEELASRSEAIALVLPVEVKYSLHSNALALREVGAASLWASSDASLLTSRLRTLAHSVLVLALRLRTILELRAGSGSETTLASISTHRGALTLALRKSRGCDLWRTKLASYEAESRDFFSSLAWS